MDKKITIKNFLLRQIDLAACGCDDIEFEIATITAQRVWIAGTEFTYPIGDLKIKRFIFRVPNQTTVYRVTENSLSKFRTRILKSKCFGGKIDDR